MPEKKRNHLIFLKDILESILKIETYTNNLSFDEFKANDMAIDAVIRNFEIIGEAITYIPVEITGKYHEIEWREAKGFRNILIHNYFGVDAESLWDTIRNNLPDFKRKINYVLENEIKS